MSALNLFARKTLTTLLLLVPVLAWAAPGAVQWRHWSPAVFQQAKQEHKLVLLDLAAAWCHWCHVMDEKTYADPDVATYLNAHYVPVRVDQDARPTATGIMAGRPRYCSSRTAPSW